MVAASTAIRQSMTEPAHSAATPLPPGTEEPISPASATTANPVSLPSPTLARGSPDLEAMSREELIQSLALARSELAAAKASGSRSSLLPSTSTTPIRSADSARRESVLFMRLTAKEQEVQECLSQLEEVRSSMGNGLRGLLLDPVAAAMFARLRNELSALKAEVEKGQQEALAWKFTPDSTTGKRLMAKCRSLIAENEELGKAVESGRLAHLEGQLALLKAHKDELHKGQAEVEDLMGDLDEDCEGLQATVVTLQRELEAARADNAMLRGLLGKEEEVTGSTRPEERPISTDSPAPSTNGLRSPHSTGHHSSLDHHSDNGHTSDHQFDHPPDSTDPLSESQSEMLHSTDPLSDGQRTPEEGHRSPADDVLGSEHGETEEAMEEDGCVGPEPKKSRLDATASGPPRTPGKSPDLNGSPHINGVANT